MKKSRKIMLTVAGLLLAALVALGVYIVILPDSPAAIIFHRQTGTFKKGGASQDVLYSDDKFVAAMAPYKALTEGLREANAIPGLQGAWSLQNNANPTAKRNLIKVDTFDPQGLAVGGGKIYISAYDHSHKANSVIFVLNKKTGNYEKTIVLQHQDHAGGIAYDGDRNLLWVAGHDKQGAKMYAIKTSTIASYNILSEVPIAYAATYNLETSNNASTVTYFDHALWVGFFSVKGEGNIQEFEVKTNADNQMTIGRQWAGSDNIADVSSTRLITGVNQMQGLAANDTAVLMTSSFSNKNSKIIRYERRADGSLQNGTYVTMPPYLETVAFDGDTGRFYALFESATPAYRDKTKAVVDRVLYVDANIFSRYDKPYKDLRTPPSVTVDETN
jgi:hypothetical protein